MDYNDNILDKIFPLKLIILHRTPIRASKYLLSYCLLRKTIEKIFCCNRRNFNAKIVKAKDYPSAIQITEEMKNRLKKNMTKLCSKYCLIHFLLTKAYQL